MVTRDDVFRFLKILLLLLLVDWVFGVATACGRLPLWTFVLPNIPFGFLHVWFESHWTGTGYVLGGRMVHEGYAMLVFPAVILLQAGFYWLVDTRLLAAAKSG